MANEDFERGAPMLEDAYGALAGSGTTAEAYTAYNLAFTRFRARLLPRRAGALDRSESIQGERKEISRLRHRAEKSCDGNGDGAEGGKGKEQRQRRRLATTTEVLERVTTWREAGDRGIARPHGWGRFDTDSNNDWGVSNAQGNRSSSGTPRARSRHGSGRCRDSTGADREDSGDEHHASGWSAGKTEDDLFQQVVDKFNSTHPAIHVDYSIINGDYTTAMTARFAAQIRRTSSTLTPSSLPTWAKQGVLQPLNSYMKGSKFDTSKFYPGAAQYVQGREDDLRLPEGLVAARGGDQPGHVAACGCQAHRRPGPS